MYVRVSGGVRGFCLSNPIYKSEALAVKLWNLKPLAIFIESKKSLDSIKGSVWSRKRSTGELLSISNSLFTKDKLYDNKETLRIFVVESRLKNFIQGMI